MIVGGRHGPRRTERLLLWRGVYPALHADPALHTSRLLAFFLLPPSSTETHQRQARYIEEGYEPRGLSAEEAERRAGATVKTMTGGGKKGGSG